MLENIVIDCSPLSNSLRVCRVGKSGTNILEQENRENEIISAVRDFLVALAERNESNTFGYEWKRKDGKIVELRLTIKEDEKTE